MNLSAYEKLLAGAAFVVAAALAFIALLINRQHELTAGVLMGIAQFLVFAASILHIDYKLYLYGHQFFSKRAEKQQPTEPTQG